MYPPSALTRVSLEIFQPFLFFFFFFFYDSLRICTSAAVIVLIKKAYPPRLALHFTPVVVHSFEGPLLKVESPLKVSIVVLFMISVAWRASFFR